MSNAFPDIVQGRMSNASIFDQINWQKSKATFTFLSNEYDKAFYNWKRSGFHGEFPEEEGVEPGTEPHYKKKPFSDFVQGNQTLLYMHRFVHQFPDCLSSITSKWLVFSSLLFFHLLTHFCFASDELPDGCFHESTGAGNGVKRGSGTGGSGKKGGAAEAVKKIAAVEMALEVGREEKQKNISIWMVVMTELVVKQEETCEVLKSRD